MACMFFVYPKRLPNVEPQTNNLANLATGVKNITLFFVINYKMLMSKTKYLFCVMD